MRLKLTIIVVFFSINSFAQIHNYYDDIIDCELLTNDAINSIVENYNTSKFDSLDIITNKMIYNCGITECTQRIIILRNILEGRSSTSAIETYFENKFYYRFKYRMTQSERINFGYVYSINKMYYDYVPLRHQVDSLSFNLAKQLLQTSRLTADERLICILFSGDVDGFNKEVENREYNDTYISQFLRKSARENKNNQFVYQIYAGAFKPLSTNSIFSYSPMLGISMTSPLSFKLMIELALKVRFNINDKSFKYFAFGDTNSVNSSHSFFAGVLFSYKLYESDKIIILPKIGIGLEVVNTGLTDNGNNNNDTEYYDIETANITLGLTTMKPIFKKHYIGLGINYHYCPYQTNKNLITKFNNNLVSTELFWRF